MKGLIELFDHIDDIDYGIDDSCFTCMVFSNNQGRFLLTICRKCDRLFILKLSEVFQCQTFNNHFTSSSTIFLNPANAITIADKPTNTFNPTAIFK